MQRLRSAAAVALLMAFVCSCKDAGGFSKKSGDLGSFIVERAAAFGARAPKSGALPKFEAQWTYREDKDGFQIYMPGDHFSELQSFLTAAFGPPEVPPATNSVAGGQAVAVSYGSGLGVALNYNCEDIGDGKQLTTLVVMRQRK